MFEKLVVFVIGILVMIAMVLGTVYALNKRAETTGITASAVF